MAVVITNRARKSIRDFYWNCTKKNIQRSQETNSLVDAMTKLIKTTPLAISKESRGILELWKNKGYTIYKSTHYFIRYGFGIDVKPMTTRNKMARKWYFACILDVSKDTIYIVNAIYAKYIDRMVDDTPTAQKFMRAIKGLETKKKRAQAKVTQLTIPFPENEAKIRYNRLIENNNATNKIINMNNKKIVRLTESDLHNIIKESVSQILNELNWKTKYNAGRKEQDLFDRFTQGERNFTDSERKRLKRRGKELGGLGYDYEYNKKSPFLDAAETDFEEQYGDKFQGEDGATYGVRADFFNKGDIYPYRDSPAEEWNDWGIDTETGDVKPFPMKGRYITGPEAFDFDKTGRLRKSYDKAKTEFNTLR